MKARGFTLVELLVAIAILAMVAVLGWRGLDSIVRSRQALTAQMDATRGLQLAFAQLQSDGEHLADPKLLNGRPVVAADNAQLSMIRMVYPEQQASRLQVVTYRIENGVLTRRESLTTRDLVQLDVMWQAAVSGQDAAPPVVLQPGVGALAVRVFENRQWQPALTPSQSRDATATSPSRVIPGGLEVALAVPGQEAPLTKVFILGGV